MIVYSVKCHERQFYLTLEAMTDSEEAIMALLDGGVADVLYTPDNGFDKARLTFAIRSK